MRRLLQIFRLIGALARAVRRLGGNPSIEKVVRGADPGAAGAPLAEIQGGAWKEYTADLQTGPVRGRVGERCRAAAVDRSRR